MRHNQCPKGKRTAVRGAWAQLGLAIAVTAGLLAGSARSGAAQVLTQGPSAPGAVTSDGSFGTSPWTNPTNAIGNDGSYAVTAPGGVPTQYLKATNFGFSIPGPAQILGIEVGVDRRSTVGTVFDVRARIVKGNVVGSAERALPGTWPTMDTTVTYGTPSDLWGETWLPADINGVGFGFALSVADGVDAAAVDAITITVHYSLCASAPAAGCRTAQKSVLVVKDGGVNSTKDKLVWKWIKGQTTTQADFQNPIATARYALCVYGNGALVGESLVTPSPSWSLLSTKGYKYLDKNGTQDGIQKIILKGSAGNKAKVLVKGKGANLDDIVPPLALPVRVQLVNSDNGECFEGVFATPADVKKNAAGLFKGNSQ